MNFQMIERLRSIEHHIGNTPIHKLRIEGFPAEVYAKLEYVNFGGSVKSRPAYNILLNAIRNGQVNEKSMVVESSSGNFAIALAMLCKLVGIDFIPVIDPNINPAYEKLLRLLCREVIKVTEEDPTGGYLQTRLREVREFCEQHENAFWPNQYENRDNAQAYYQFMGAEVTASFDRLNYAFIGVSSCGTIAGLSRRLKEEFPGIKIIAIDVEGSVIFSDTPKKRHISGIGSSIVPPLVQLAQIDEVIHLRQTDIITGCLELVNEQMLFAGASSGASYFAIKKYFEHYPQRGAVPKVLFICPDRGDAYLDTVYDPKWNKKIKEGPALMTESTNFSL
jgi:2,3-diaminopropionate biosynthesis protein SbnA